MGFSITHLAANAVRQSVRCFDPLFLERSIIGHTARTEAPDDRGRPDPPFLSSSLELVARMWKRLRECLAPLAVRGQPRVSRHSRSRWLTREPISSLQWPTKNTVSLAFVRRSGVWLKHARLFSLGGAAAWVAGAPPAVLYSGRGAESTGLSGRLPRLLRYIIDVNNVCIY